MIQNSKHFRWFPGMLDAWCNDRVAVVHHDGTMRWACYSDFTGWELTWATPSNGQPSRPDLEDPATQGAIVFGILEPLGVRISRMRNDKYICKFADRAPTMKEKNLPSLPAAIEHAFLILESRENQPQTV